MNLQPEWSYRNKGTGNELDQMTPNVGVVDGLTPTGGRYENT